MMKFRKNLVIWFLDVYFVTGIAEIDIDQDEDACSGDDEDDDTDSVIGMYRHLQDQGQTQVYLFARLQHTI